MLWYFCSKHSVFHSLLLLPWITPRPFYQGRQFVNLIFSDQLNDGGSSTNLSRIHSRVLIAEKVDTRQEEKQEASFWNWMHKDFCVNATCSSVGVWHLGDPSRVDIYTYYKNKRLSLLLQNILVTTKEETTDGLLHFSHYSVFKIHLHIAPTSSPGIL